MGLDFIRDQKAGFDQQRDASRSRELDLDLFSNARPDVETRLFKCELTDQDTQIIPGLRLVLRAHSETDVTVIQSGKVIGHIAAEDVGRLTSLMKKNRTHTGILGVSAKTEPDFTGGFKVYPSKLFKET